MKSKTVYENGKSARPSPDEIIIEQPEELLALVSSYDKISLEDAGLMYRQIEMKTILSKYNFPSKPSSDGRWKIYAKDQTSKEGRRKLAAKTLDELKNKVIAFEKGVNGQLKKTFKDGFEIVQEQKLRYTKDPENAFRILKSKSDRRDSNPVIGMRRNPGKERVSVCSSYHLVTKRVTNYKSITSRSLTVINNRDLLHDFFCSICQSFQFFRYFISKNNLSASLTFQTRNIFYDNNAVVILNCEGCLCLNLIIRKTYVAHDLFSPFSEIFIPSFFIWITGRYHEYFKAFISYNNVNPVSIRFKS